ncbi:MAG: sugar kinase [Sphingomonadales bacterium]|jgi:2-dehydro-3-deoxygluconokinase
MVAAGRFVGFGELLIRLSAPGRSLLMQTPSFDIHIGGAEANVATALARLGHATSMVSAVPDNALGAGAVAALRSHGVDTSGVQVRAGRMGLYFLAMGAGLRASEVVYDRAESSFAAAPASSYDWPTLLAGAGRLHLSGITPALNEQSAAAAIAAAEAATALGIPVSFDGNFRAQLWAARSVDPRPILARLIGHADILFGNHRDVALVLGGDFGSDGDADARAAAAAFAAFPRLTMIASTNRETLDADRHRLAARIDRRDGHDATDPVLLSGVVDRIGAGDAFAAGVLHGLSRGGPAEAARTGLALACLKHALPGDASLFTQRDLDAYFAGTVDVRR